MFEKNESVEETTMFSSNSTSIQSKSVSNKFQFTPSNNNNNSPKSTNSYQFQHKSDPVLLPPPPPLLSHSQNFNNYNQNQQTTNNLYSNNGFSDSPMRQENHKDLFLKPQIPKANSFISNSNNCYNNSSTNNNNNNNNNNNGALYSNIGNSNGPSKCNYIEK